MDDQVLLFIPAIDINRMGPRECNLRSFLRSPLLPRDDSLALSRAAGSAQRLSKETVEAVAVTQKKATLS